MFNIQGSELIFLLLIALVILGPDKLPEAVRKFSKAYGEFRKMANGFQGELRQAFEEPVQEMRDTADIVRQSATFDLGPDAEPPAAPAPPPTRPTPPVRSSGPAAPSARTPQSSLNFGNSNARRQARVSRSTPIPGSVPEATPAPAEEPDE